MTERDRSEGVTLSNEDRYRMDKLLEEIHGRVAEMNQITNRALGQSAEEGREAASRFLLGIVAQPANGVTKPTTFCEVIGSGENAPVRCFCYDPDSGECTPGVCEEEQCIIHEVGRERERHS